MCTSLERSPGTNLTRMLGARAERGMRAVPRSVRKFSGPHRRLGTEALRRIDRTEEPARNAAEAARVGQAGGSGDLLPGLVAEWMWHPRVTAIRVVLHDDEPAAGPKVRGERPDDGDLSLARHVMEAVRGDEAIELGQLERAGQVRCHGEQRHVGE